LILQLRTVELTMVTVIVVSLVLVLASAVQHNCAHWNCCGAFVIV
jgi:hypothetical protein